MYYKIKSEKEKLVMKKIINGRLYDTDTAKAIGSYSNGYGAGDLYYLNETLYRKKTGEFFLFGDGGAKTKYGVECGNRCWTSSTGINPLMEEEAKECVEEHLDADIYIDVFGTVEE